MKKKKKIQEKKPLFGKLI